MHVGVVCATDGSGGAEEYLRRLDREFTGQGDRLTLVGGIPDWRGETIPVALGPKWRTRTLLSSLLRLPAERRALHASIKDTTFDAFHVQFKREQVGFTRMLAKRAPVVWTEHGRFDGKIRALIGPAYRAASKHAERIICVSDAVAQSIEPLVHDASKLVVIENPADTDRFHPASEEERRIARRVHGIPESASVVLWVGRMDPSKLPDLAAAVATVWPGPVLMMGQGSEFERIGRLVDGTDLRVFSQGDPTMLYQAADVFLFTSTGHGEGLPTVILEAAASGLVTVANGGNGLESIVQTAGGYTVPRDAPLTEWVRALRDAANDESRRAVALEWAQAHTLEAWARAHRAAIHSPASFTAPSSA
jgi:glycosyltransferase involved in cell wall biosynthesis